MSFKSSGQTVYLTFTFTFYALENRNGNLPSVSLRISGMAEPVAASWGQIELDND